MNTIAALEKIRICENIEPPYKPLSLSNEVSNFDLHEHHSLRIHARREIAAVNRNRLSRNKRRGIRCEKNSRAG